MTLAPEKLTAPQEVIDAVHQAVLDAADGYFLRDPGKTARAYHPEFVGRIFETGETGVPYLITHSRQGMIDFAQLDHLRIDDPQYEILIDDIFENMAAVRFRTDVFIDLFHVVKARGEWRLLHTSYAETDASYQGPQPEDVDGVTAAAMNYIEAWFQGDAERHARAYHDECLKRAFFIDPDTGKDTLKTITPLEMVDYCATGQSRLGDCAMEVVIDEIYRDVATVRVYSCKYVDFLHIAKARGEWRLLHVTWHRRLE